jgi:acyl-CoA synthetase (AMP-forming)/AMP-acid ligase II
MKATIPAILNNSVNNEALISRAKKIGAFIASKTQEKDVVAIAKRTGQDLIASFLGCIIYNRIPIIIQQPSVKIHPIEFDKKMQAISNEIDISLCICEEVFENDFSKFFPVISKLEEAYRPVPAFPNPDDVAFIQLSSGTTGKVKILKVKHKDVIENCNEYGNTIGFARDSVVCSWLPLYHDMGLITSFLLPLLYDCKFSLIDPFEWLANPVIFLKSIQENKATHIWMPNFAFQFLANKIADTTGLDLSS